MDRAFCRCPKAQCQTRIAFPQSVDNMARPVGLTVNRLSQCAHRHCLSRLVAGCQRLPMTSFWSHPSEFGMVVVMILQDRESFRRYWGSRALLDRRWTYI